MVADTAFLLFAYAVASLWESRFHHHVLHARRHSRQVWRTWGSFGALMRLAHFFHHTVHHRRTFQRSLLVQFDSPDQRASLDRRLTGDIGRRARLDRYGLTVTGSMELLAFVGLPLAINSLVAVCVDPRLLPVGALASVLPFLLSRYVHPLLHQPTPPPDATGLVNALCRTSALRFLQNYHLLHHRRRNTNFNLLLGADWVLGHALSPQGQHAEQRGEA